MPIRCFRCLSPGVPPLNLARLGLERHLHGTCPNSGLLPPWPCDTALNNTSRPRISSPRLARMSSEKKDEGRTQNVSEQISRPRGDSLAEYSQLEPYGKPGLRGALSSHSRYVLICGFVVRLGGFLFGYDQGVVSIILTTDQFISVFPRIADVSTRYFGKEVWPVQACGR